MKWKSWLGGAAAAAVCACLVLAVVLPGPGVTKASFDQIEDGMSFEQVNAVLGRPPDGIQVKGKAPPRNGLNEAPLRKDPKEVCYYWKGDQGIAYVAFSSDIRVKYKDWKEQPTTF